MSVSPAETGLDYLQSRYYDPVTCRGFVAAATAVCIVGSGFAAATTAATLSYTNQLKDFVLYSQSNGLEMHLYTNAHLTGPLQQAVDSGLIQVFPLK